MDQDLEKARDIMLRLNARHRLLDRQEGMSGEMIKEMVDRQKADCLLLLGALVEVDKASTQLLLDELEEIPRRMYDTVAAVAAGELPTGLARANGEKATEADANASFLCLNLHRHMLIEANDIEVTEGIIRPALLGINTMATLLGFALANFDQFLTWFNERSEDLDFGPPQH